MGLAVNPKDISTPIVITDLEQMHLGAAGTAGGEDDSGDGEN